MTADVIPDTNVIIDVLRGRTAAVAFVRELASKPSVSSVSVAEIFAGLRTQRAELSARGLLHTCRMIPVSATIGEQAGTLLRHYRPSHGLDLADAVIAATAEQYGLKLATLNVKHFPMFPKLKPAY